MAVCLFHQGNTTEAYRQFARAARDFPTNPENHYYLGRIDTARGYGVRAEKHLLLAEQFKTTHADLHVLMARACALQGRHLGSLREVSMGGRTPTAGTRTPGGVIVRVDSPQEGTMIVAPKASALFRATLALDTTCGADPDDTQRMVLIVARSYALAGDAERAGTYLAKLTRAWRSRADAVTLRVEVDVARGRLDDAHATVNRAHADKTLSAEVTVRLLHRVALARLAAGQPAEAERHLEQVLAVDAHFAPALRMLGRARAARGDSAGAVTVLV